MVSRCFIGSLERLLDRLMSSIFFLVQLRISGFNFFFCLGFLVWYQFILVAITCDDSFYIFGFDRVAYNEKVEEGAKVVEPFEVSKGVSLKSFLPPNN